MQSRTSRIIGIDLARGIALLGMLGAHVGFFGPFDWGTPSSWTDLVNGRSAILFAVLAGVSLAIITRTARSMDADELRALRLRLVGRGAAIMTVGLLLEGLNTGIQVILTMYGALYVAVIPFLGWSVKRLLLTAAALVVVAPPLLELAKWASAESGSPGLALLLFGSYPVTVWIPLLFVGMAIGRLDLARARVAGALVLIGGVLAVGGYTAAQVMPDAIAGRGSTAVPDGTTITPYDELDPSTHAGWDCFDDPTGDTLSCFPPGALGADEDDDAAGALGALGQRIDTLGATWDDTTVLRAWVNAAPHSGGSLELVASGGLAVAVLGVCLLVARPLRWVVVPIAALGSMPLSGYALHVVLFFLGLNAITTEPLVTWAILAGVLLVSATTWWALVGRGPLERLTAAVGRLFADPRPAGARRESAADQDPQAATDPSPDPLSAPRS